MEKKWNLETKWKLKLEMKIRNGNGNRLMSSVLHHYSSTVDREIFAVKIFRPYA